MTKSSFMFIFLFLFTEIVNMFASYAFEYIFTLLKTKKKNYCDKGKVISSCSVFIICCCRFFFPSIIYLFTIISDSIFIEKSNANVLIKDLDIIFFILSQQQINSEHVKAVGEMDRKNTNSEIKRWGSAKWQKRKKERKKEIHTDKNFDKLPQKIPFF